jgi:hypothetical protein
MVVRHGGQQRAPHVPDVRYLDLIRVQVHPLQRPAQPGPPVLSFYCGGVLPNVLSAGTHDEDVTRDGLLVLPPGTVRLTRVLPLGELVAGDPAHNGREVDADVDPFLRLKRAMQCKSAWRWENVRAITREGNGENLPFCGKCTDLKLAFDRWELVLHQTGERRISFCGGGLVELLSRLSTPVLSHVLEKSMAPCLTPLESMPESMVSL